jgi:hypothetical protein
MGEVHRARDTKLGRGVAIKVLPEAWARDPERLARIDREARVLASLNHPSIASLFGYEERDGTRLPAMELVPGPKRRRLQSMGDGRLDLEEALHGARTRRRAGLASGGGWCRRRWPPWRFSFRAAAGERDRRRRTSILLTRRSIEVTGIAWVKQDLLLFTDDSTGAVMSVSSNGGRPEVFLKCRRLSYSSRTLSMRRAFPRKTAIERRAGGSARASSRSVSAWATLT